MPPATQYPKHRIFTICSVDSPQQIAKALRENLSESQVKSVVTWLTYREDLEKARHLSQDLRDSRWPTMDDAAESEVALDTSLEEGEEWGQDNA